MTTHSMQLAGVRFAFTEAGDYRSTNGRDWEERYRISPCKAWSIFASDARYTVCSQDSFCWKTENCDEEMRSRGHILGLRTEGMMTWIPRIRRQLGTCKDDQPYLMEQSAPNPGDVGPEREA